MAKLNRRDFVGIASVVLTSLGFAKSAAALAPTPRQTEGPFYPDVMPSDTDNDLVRIASKTQEAGGEILILTGTILDTKGKALSGALIEIWQCDMHGNYLHTEGASSEKRDHAFQGYGRTRTDAEGRYRFRTIKPVPYPGRTPHIHVKAHHPDGRTLTTQMYVDGEAANARDFIYRSLSTDERKRITVALNRAEPAAPLTGNFDIVL